VVCFARHDQADAVLGRAMCLDCYDYDHQVVWNLFTGELWRRTKQAAERYLAQLAKARGIPSLVVPAGDGKWKKIPPVRLSHGKVAEFQIRGAVHFHALIRLDGVDPLDAAAVVPPPAGFSSVDLEDAIRYAAQLVAVDTPPHPNRPAGWHVVWGGQLDVRHITLSGKGEVTDSMAAGYLAKYATKSTEITGHNSTRITADNIDLFADPNGSHVARLIAACWRLGRPDTPPRIRGIRTGLLPNPDGRLRRWTCPKCGIHTRLRMCLSCGFKRQGKPDAKPPTDATPDTTEGTHTDEVYGGLRRWAHMLGFGGHFLTKARRYSVTFGTLRAARTTHRRATDAPADEPIRAADHTAETTLIVGGLSFAGIGWHTTGDAALAATSAAMARARHEAARDAAIYDHEP
jgi:hypothetical protein